MTLGKVKRIDECVKGLKDEANDLMCCLNIPSLKNGTIDIKSCFNDVFDNTESIRYNGDSISFPVNLRNETKNVIVSFVRLDSEDSIRKMVSEFNCEYGYEIYTDGFVMGEYKLPVIVINGWKHMLY